MKRSHLFAVALSVFSLALFTSLASAEKAPAKSVSGKSACATCTGVTSAGHNIMIVAEDGTRWVLIADKPDNESYKAAHKQRTKGVTMTATTCSEPVTKTDEKGKEYKEVKVSEVKVG